MSKKDYRVLEYQKVKTVVTENQYKFCQLILRNGIRISLKRTRYFTVQVSLQKHVKYIEKLLNSSRGFCMSNIPLGKINCIYMLHTSFWCVMSGTEAWMQNSHLVEFWKRTLVVRLTMYIHFYAYKYMWCVSMCIYSCFFSFPYKFWINLKCKRSQLSANIIKFAYLCLQNCSAV